MTATRQFTDRQQDLIKTVISGFTFSSNTNDLPKQIKQLTSALTSTTATPANPYYWLGECIRNPGKYFQELVLHEDEACTIHDIQFYILESIHARLTKAANTARLQLTSKSLQWNYDQIIAAIIKEDDKTTWFKSEKTRVDGGEHPWQLPMISGKIYTRAIRLIIDDSFPEIPETQAWVDVTFNGSNNKKPETFFVASVPDFDALIDSEPYEENDELKDENDKTEEETEEEIRERRKQIAEHNFVIVMQENAEKLALDCATEYALSHITASTIDKNKAKNQSETQKIITHEYYFNFLKKKNIRLSYFVDSTEQQAINFTDEVLINLLQKNICDYAQLKKMTEAQRKVATHPTYHAMLIDNTLLMKEICNLSDVRAQFITHPFVSTLISSHKLTWGQAKTLPRHLFPLFKNRLYCQYVKQSNVYEELLKLRNDHIPLMQNPTFASLVTSGQINLANVVNLSEAMTAHLLQHTYIIDWIKSGATQLDEFIKYANEKKLSEFYIHVYSKRLTAIFNNYPYLINKTVDNIDVLIKEIPTVATTCQMEATFLQEWIIYNFIKDLDNHLKTPSTPTNTLYKEMLSVINPQTEGNMKWSDVLENLINLADSHSRGWTPSLGFITNLFATRQHEENSKKRKVSNDTENISDFCSRLSSLRPMIANITTNLVYRSPNHQ